MAVFFLLLLPVGTGVYPTIWKLVLASVKTGVTEVIYIRLLLIPLIVWVAQLIRRAPDRRPSNRVYWAAIIIAGLWFGWEHVEDRMSIPGIHWSILFRIMLINTTLGIIFGWQFWKLGLEAAVISHFAVDVWISVFIAPVFLSSNPMAWLFVGGLSQLLGWVSLRLIME